MPDHKQNSHQRFTPWVIFRQKLMDSNYMLLKLLRNDYYRFFFFHQLRFSKQTTYLMHKNCNNQSSTKTIRTL